MIKNPRHIQRYICKSFQCKLRYLSKRSKNPVKIPTYISVRKLARLLNTTQANLSSKCNDLFDWWPKISQKSIRKHGGRLHNIVLSCVEATLIANKLSRAAEPIDVETEGIDAFLTKRENRHYMQICDKPRTPIISILGHVDHGKTTLLDALTGSTYRKSEVGDITQDVYVSSVNIFERQITLIDTPGHELFMEMRSTGSYFADIMIVVIDIKEGCCAQTHESISLALDYETPIIVFINKIDTVVAVDTSKQTIINELNARYSTNDVNRMTIVCGSALKHTNLDHLMCILNEQINALDISGNTCALPRGTVIESYKLKTRGNIVRMLLYHGTLKLGQLFVCGGYVGRVKNIKIIGTDSSMVPRIHGTTVCTTKNVKSVEPGIAFELMGINGLPNAGDDFIAGLTTELNEAIAEQRVLADSYPDQERFIETTNDDTDDRMIVPVIVKARNSGSLMAITKLIDSLSNNVITNGQPIEFAIIRMTLGNVTPKDVDTAESVDGVLVCYRVRSTIPYSKCVNIQVFSELESKLRHEINE